MKLRKICAVLETHYCANLDYASEQLADGNEAMEHYFEGCADGIKLALRYLARLDKKETAAPASTAANPL
ncbi:MAG: hypothetical protein IJO56_05810 [Oscillospiraceae bacterium]|nr:hypothetical protein [Oscillospiraceae bacterium]